MASATQRQRKRWTDFLTCRQVLNIMVIVGFMFNYMLRVNMTIAIISMVVDTTNSTTAAAATGMMTTEASNGEFLMTENALFSSNLSTSSAVGGEDDGYMITDEDGFIKFKWDKYTQNLILGCFFWGYILTELPGGRMAEIVGARKIFGGGMLAASLITLLTPLSCRLNFILVVILRVLLGFFLGATWPAIPPMAAKWIPPLERSKFIANMMASALGAAITMPVCGFLISSLGWESVFYVTGGIALVWSVAWFFLVFDSPADHPRITDEEREEIESKIAAGAGKGVKPSRVPWKAIFTSMPVWAIIITHGCSVFCYFTVVNQLPTFIKDVLHFDIKKNGLFSSLPYLGKYIMAVIASYFADRLRRSGRFSTTATRKGFTAFAVLIPGLLMVLQAFWGYSAPLSISIFTMSLFFNGAVTAGYLANGLDIAPNFSGTIFGMANTLSSIGGWVSTAIVAAITHEESTFEQWRYVFWILVGAYAIGGGMFCTFGTGELQPWNSVMRAGGENGANAENGKSQEMQPLNGKDEDNETRKNGHSAA